MTTTEKRSAQQGFPNLVGIREEAGATLGDWAPEIGVSSSTLSRIERGYFTRLDLAVALRIARVYGVPVERLEKAVA